MNNEKDFIILMMILNILSNDVGEVLADEQGYIEQQTDTEKFYTVRTETYLDNKIVIHYPQIEGLEDDNKEQMINKLILDHILDGLSERDVKSFK